MMENQVFILYLVINKIRLEAVECMYPYNYNNGDLQGHLIVNFEHNSKYIIELNIL